MASMAMSPGCMSHYNTMLFYTTCTTPHDTPQHPKCYELFSSSTCVGHAFYSSLSFMNYMHLPQGWHAFIHELTSFLPYVLHVFTARRTLLRFFSLPDTRFTNLCIPSPLLFHITYALPSPPLPTCFIPYAQLSLTCTFTRCLLLDTCFIYYAAVLFCIYIQ